MRHLVIIPGLGDNDDYVRFLTRSWERKYDIKTHVIAFGWKGKANEFEDHLNKLRRYIDNLLKQNGDVSILGISAGASAAINLFSARKHKINKVISVCGRLRDQNVKQRFYYPKMQLDIFKKSLNLCEINQEKLTKEDKERILTIRPFYDDVVPVRTMTIDGAVNRKIFAAQHGISIYLAMTLYSKTIVKLLS